MKRNKIELKLNLNVMKNNLKNNLNKLKKKNILLQKMTQRIIIKNILIK